MISLRYSRCLLGAMTLAALLCACRRTGPDPMAGQSVEELRDQGDARPLAEAPGSFRAFTAWLHSGDDA